MSNHTMSSCYTQADRDKLAHYRNQTATERTSTATVSGVAGQASARAEGGMGTATGGPAAAQVALAAIRK